MGVLSQLKHGFAHGWNSFMSNDNTANRPVQTYTAGYSSSTRPDRTRVRIHSERTIIASIYTRLAIDVAGVRIEHVRVNPETEQYEETIRSGLNDCLKVQANLDQAGRHFRQDMAWSLFNEGCIAIVPVDTTLDPRMSGTWDIKSLRVGVILDWWPSEVRVRAYNEKKGLHEDIVLPKSMVAIVENPFYAVMNEPNSTLQRLVHKLSLLDNIDEIASSGKLDIIIKLPYVVKSETRKNQAEARAQAITDQLKDSTYGIAYIDGTEDITQLNRSVENNLLEQVKFLKEQLFNELGLTEAIMNGTATSTEMLNYRNRTIEPIMDAITEAMIRSFLTKTARTQGQTMMYFESPFRLLSIAELADVVDVLSRNQIIKPNEVRPVLGLKPSKEPQADKLINSNMPLDMQLTDGTNAEVEAIDPADAEEAALNAEMAELGIE